MKKNIFIFVALAALLCSSCATITTSSSSSFSSSSDDLTTTTSSTTSSTSTTTSYPTSISVDSNPNTLDFYAINDFHGHLQENINNHEPGLARIKTYLNYEKQKNPDGFVFLSSGDTFQETYDSSINKGEIMAKALPLMECETMALGNHEFDWGIDIIKRNAKFAGSCTFLAANLYYYDEENKQVLDFANDIVKEYKIIERGDFKIGIIGIIGQEQITSITSSIWEGLTFLEPTEIVKSLSDELKGELGCDVVVVSAHAGFDDLGYTFANQVTSISPVTNKRYIDACFTAHSHGFDDENINNVPFLQSGSKGQYISHIKLEVKDDGSVSRLYAQSEPIMMDLPQDYEIQSYLDSYFDEAFYQEKDEIVGTIEGASYLSRSLAGNLLAYTTYDLLEDENIEVDVVMNNGGRNSINLFDNGGISLGLIYDALPFLNTTYVSSIKGSEIMSEINHGNTYYAPNLTKIYPNEYYTLACIDYLLLHKDVDRKYDYFPTYDGNYTHIITDYSYEIVYDYFKENKTISISTLNNDAGFSNLD